MRDFFEVDPIRHPPIPSQLCKPWRCRPTVERDPADMLGMGYTTRTVPGLGFEVGCCILDMCYREGQQRVSGRLNGVGEWRGQHG